ncbi:hypothetical protein GCM10009616_19740 [Microlunatus lacustris]
MTAELTAGPPPAELSMVPLMSFDEASEQVLDYLRALIPMRFWAVSAHDVEGDRQVYLHLRDQTGRRAAGDFSAWSESFCQYVLAGVSPQIAADAMAVPQYAAISAAGGGVDIGAYVGVPIRSGQGTYFGTLCATDPDVQAEGVLEQHAPLLQLLATLLGQILTREQLQAEAEEREATLRWRAFHDGLTGLPNRALFNDRLDQALALQALSRPPLVVLTLDVDDFKAVNDSFGHAGGDELLTQLARRLRGAVRSGDALARMGGDEFAVLLEHTGDHGAAAAADQAAGRIQAALAEPFVVAGRRVEVGVSVGVVSVEPGTDPPDAEVLLARADLALYSAKRAGKSRAVAYHPAMRLPETSDLQLRDPLREAVENRQIRAVYQPVVALATGAVIGVECLARWTHQGRPVSPEVFIPLAARSRLSSALTMLMVDQACAQLRRWCAALGHDRLQMAVNVPPELLTDPQFAERITAQVVAAGLHPRQLTLEITEDALFTDPDAARRVAEQLHDRGFRLALDDFGTGYSSLLHLRSIPLDVMKIDRGFSSDVDTNPQTRFFLRALLGMGHDLGLRVVVEGVERESQADALRDLGAVYGQGYRYARPAPPDELDLAGAVVSRGQEG